MLSFSVAAFFVVAMCGLIFANFFSMKKEIAFLEVANTIRSKCFDLRRHEKNYFLYEAVATKKESELLFKIFNELKDIITTTPEFSKSEKLHDLNNLLDVYGKRFETIVTTVDLVKLNMEKIKTQNENDYYLLRLIYTDHPDKVSTYLLERHKLAEDSDLIVQLRKLDSDIISLRKEGERILNLSNELDKKGREKVDLEINKSQTAIALFLPLSLIIGIGSLLLLSTNIVRQLNDFKTQVENMAKGNFRIVYHESTEVEARDEIGIIKSTFNEMQKQLFERDMEIKKKNAELLQSRKLAAIGTLASGVAHELNNPLNNIYLSAQVLLREMKDNENKFITKIIGDISGQTKRVRGIVSDLLEFARGKETQLAEVEINRIITSAYQHTVNIRPPQEIDFIHETVPSEIFMRLDMEQIERVFINLFNNAFDVMIGGGQLTIMVKLIGEMVSIEISDTGPGISAENAEKIFEPFYTTKDRGTGLGLSIVYGIIKKHGGDITLEPKAGHGTCFKIVLPLESKGEYHAS
ncbi:ATP-binding protein [Candidatus Magnetomonas plexicatena]|uniref:ATP-binding protein n=1 Tax=Candidatus Magnetomonas plexicatena TaxID=2552947 RepID=UPI001C771960|nr:HAMP domain-containing protein [Nitrospirales bacterium LBB_01]